MSRYREEAYDDEPDEPDESDEYDASDPDYGYAAPYEDYEYETDGEPTVPCPYCRREIHEDAERCPHCEHYISAVDAPPARKPWWLIVGVAVCLYVVYRWMFG